MRSVLDNVILNTMYKGITTIQDFCWDNLTTTPILYLMSADDIEYIRKIITSPRYSGNNKLKMEKIDELMHFRGFSKFAGGTNRLVYTHPSAPNAVFKVAIDSVGINDNPAEFRNQKFLKPYCCKVFECSPCGTIASFEKVDRITTFEEFYTIADDYFYLLSRVILGKYVMEDIGIDYFMNVGIRKGFGVVILDFPYLFELDGAKLECASILDDGTMCKGEIDYDHGFNKLICSKCGRIYRARDLAKPPKSGGIFVCKKGVNRMKISIVQGDKVLKSINAEPEHDFFIKEKILPKKKERTHISASISTVSVPVENHQVTKHETVQTKPADKHVTHYVAIDDNAKKQSNNDNQNVKIIPVYVSLGGSKCQKLDTVQSEASSTLKVHVVSTANTENAEKIKSDVDINKSIIDAIDEKGSVDITKNNKTDNVDTTNSIEENSINIIKEEVPAIEESAIVEVSETEQIEESINEVSNEVSMDKQINEAEMSEDQFAMYETPALNDSLITFSEDQSTELVNSEAVADEIANEENIDDDGLDDIVFVDELPNIEDALVNVAYCKKINPDTDVSVYKDIDDIGLIPSELFEIYIKDSITPTFFRCVVTADGEIEIYDSNEVDDAMKKLNAKNFDVHPILDITPEEEDAVTVDGDHLEEDDLIEKLKSSNKKISLEDAE